METTATGASTNGSSPALGLNSGSLAETFDNFLLLLTTQLENQDPLSPMDSNEFTQQLVSFSEVEQSIQTNDLLSELIGMQLGSQLNDAAGFIGRVAEIESSALSLQGGQGEITYANQTEGADTTIQIVDRNGVVVRTAQGEAAAGLHSFAWDGRDDNGNQLPDGRYGFNVASVDGDGAAITVATGTRGRVTGVEMGDGGILLSLGDLKVPVGDLVSLHEG